MSDKRPGRGSDQFMLRFPEGMRDEIREAAAENGRSMNSEIIARLRATLDFDIEGTEQEMSAMEKDIDAIERSLEQFDEKLAYRINMLNIKFDSVEEQLDAFCNGIPAEKLAELKKNPK